VHHQCTCELGGGLGNFGISKAGRVRVWNFSISFGLGAGLAANLCPDRTCTGEAQREASRSYLSEDWRSPTKLGKAKWGSHSGRRQARAIELLGAPEHRPESAAP